MLLGARDGRGYYCTTQHAVSSATVVHRVMSCTWVLCAALYHVCSHQRHHTGERRLALTSLGAAVHDPHAHLDLTHNWAQSPPLNSSARGPRPRKPAPTWCQSICRRGLGDRNQPSEGCHLPQASIAEVENFSLSKPQHALSPAASGHPLGTRAGLRARCRQQAVTRSQGLWAHTRSRQTRGVAWAVPWVTINTEHVVSCEDTGPRAGSHGHWLSVTPTACWAPGAVVNAYRDKWNFQSFSQQAHLREKNCGEMQQLAQGHGAHWRSWPSTGAGLGVAPSASFHHPAINSTKHGAS